MEAALAGLIHQATQRNPLPRRLSLREQSGFVRTDTMIQGSPRDARKVRLSAKEQEKLARFIGYRSELDCLMADIRAELVRDPEWRLTSSDQQQYRETLRKFQNHGVTTVPCQIAERGDQFLRQLRPIRLVLESDINALDAKRGPQSAASSHGAKNKGGRKPGIVLDGGKITFFRGEHSQGQVAIFGGISLASVQRAEAEKPVSKGIVAAIRKALRRCCGHPVTVEEISKKPTSETSES